MENRICFVLREEDGHFEDLLNLRRLEFISKICRYEFKINENFQITVSNNWGCLLYTHCVTPAFISCEYEVDVQVGKMRLHKQNKVPTFHVIWKRNVKIFEFSSCILRLASVKYLLTGKARWGIISMIACSVTTTLSNILFNSLTWKGSCLMIIALKNKV